MLSRGERRALRAIEETLATEDPVLAELLREPSAVRRARLLPRLRSAVMTIAAVMFLLALILSVAALLLVGMMALLTIPALHRWARAGPGADDT